MPESDEYTEGEAAKRRDKALNVMLDTPPKPHSKPAKSRVKKAKTSPKQNRS